MQLYCESLTDYKRLSTLEVNVGGLLIGNNHPIRIQTMTTTDTMNTEATVAQTIRCIEAGAELVRITAPSKNEAENLKLIKDELGRKGYTTPLIADIHFTPNAAEIAARIVEKVRVNPGNYADKKKFSFIEYTNEQYQSEIERIRERFSPLVKICRENGTAMRIGTNHGSLSDRIMSRYGDTPMGMVESAMEFLRIAEDHNYYNIILSMKSSNPQVMVQAYRLLIQQMQAELGHCYPLHLGVTEAGDGADGRIKSAIGIGALLEDGIGDTIRVSLTEEPEAEIPVCKELVAKYKPITNSQQSIATIPPVENIPYDPFSYQRRKTRVVDNIGGEHAPVVIADLLNENNIEPKIFNQIGYQYNAATDKWNISDTAADYILLNKALPFAIPGTLNVILPFAEWRKAENKTNYFPLFDAAKYISSGAQVPGLKFVIIDCFSQDTVVTVDMDATLRQLQQDEQAVIILQTDNSRAMPAIRRMFIELEERNIANPVIIHCESKKDTAEAALIHFAVEAGALLLDGFGDGIRLTKSPNHQITQSPDSQINNIAFIILQATRTRISRTEYISCPSCGRTLFDLQETTAKIRSVTSHLKGVKIAIMGCIVNGPGEMADADYGYVGSGVGKITLYKGKEVVKRALPADVAVNELINLIRENGEWVEPT